MEESFMDGQITWDMEELQSAYDKLGEVIQDLKAIIADNDKSNNELRQAWVTKKAEVYFNEAENAKAEAQKMISEYENTRAELLRRMQILRSMDE